MQSRQVSNFKINKMTKAQYSGIVPSQDEVYITTDEADAVLSVNGVLPNAQGNVTLNIPVAVTESTVAGWGFTKNEGTVTSVNGVSPTNGNVAITIPDVSNLANTTLSNVSNIDSGSAVQTALNNKADEDLSNVTSADMTTAMVSSNTPVITESYINGTSWYKVYSNGWCEQGGYKQRSGSTTSITLLKNYTNTNYSIQVTLEAAAANKYAATITGKTKSSISVYNGHSEAYFYWCCAGYIS